MFNRYPDAGIKIVIKNFLKVTNKKNPVLFLSIFVKTLK